MSENLILGKFLWNVYDLSVYYGMSLLFKPEQIKLIIYDFIQITFYKILRAR